MILHISRLFLHTFRKNGDIFRIIIKGESSLFWTGKLNLFFFTEETVHFKRKLEYPQNFCRFCPFFGLNKKLWAQMGQIIWKRIKMHKISTNLFKTGGLAPILRKKTVPKEDLNPQSSLFGKTLFSFLIFLKSYIYLRWMRILLGFLMGVTYNQITCGRLQQ